MTRLDIPSQRSLALWCALPLHLFLVGGKQFSLYSLLARLSVKTKNSLSSLKEKNILDKTSLVHITYASCGLTA